jgi:hypothetical protein
MIKYYRQSSSFLILEAVAWIRSVVMLVYLCLLDSSALEVGYCVLLR